MNLSLHYLPTWWCGNWSDQWTDIDQVNLPLLLTLCYLYSIEESSSISYPNCIYNQSFCQKRYFGPRVVEVQHGSRKGRRKSNRISPGKWSAWVGDVSPLIFSQNHAELQPASEFTWFQDRLPCKAPFDNATWTQKKTNKMRSIEKSLQKNLSVYTYIYILYTPIFFQSKKKKSGEKVGNTYFKAVNCPGFE